MEYFIYYTRYYEDDLYTKRESQNIEEFIDDIKFYAQRNFEVVINPKSCLDCAEYN